MHIALKWTCMTRLFILLFQGSVMLFQGSVTLDPMPMETLGVTPFSSTITLIRDSYMNKRLYVVRGRSAHATEIQGARPYTGDVLAQSEGASNLSSAV